DPIPPENEMWADGKHVVIVGGGDTGSDCVGTSVRQGADSITQLEILPQPPAERDPSTPWPEWPLQLRTSTSHQEGGTRHWSVLTKEVVGDDAGHVRALSIVEAVWEKDPGTGRMQCSEKPGSEREIRADLVLLAMGFTREGNAGILKDFGVAVREDLTARLDDNFMTSQPGVFVAGDLSTGPSLVVRAIADGRIAAEGINKYLEKRK
ncbi:MAG: FAD-dependent oxidoreductase, partial [Candidatus Pacebacteria bacterium]|nr:FAD-dependent oxidoreductase [Candidatus Paceibacterota bacterium]